MKMSLLAIALVGCNATTETHEILLRQAPPPTHAATLFVDGERLDRPVDDIGLVQVFVWGDLGERQTYVLLTERAAAIGCDAVVNARFDKGLTKSVATGTCVTWQRSTAVSR
jgi:hypothetical protein